MINNLQSILTQDNRMTSDPIFLVEGWERIFVEEGEFETYVENNSGDYCELSKSQYDELSKRWELATSFNTKKDNEIPEDPILGGDFDPDNYERREYILRPVFQTACFTEKAAQDYIDCNGHNIFGREYKEPRIYVASGWRNKEWQQIRELLIDKARIESQDVTA